MIIFTLTLAQRCAVLLGTAFWMFIGLADAATNPPTCVNDVDCIATPQCGGDVCDHNTDAGMPVCVPASTPGLRGNPVAGWCTKDSDCKCFKTQGSTCMSNQCWMTMPNVPGDCGLSVAGSRPQTAWSLACGVVGLVVLLVRRTRC